MKRGGGLNRSERHMLRAVRAMVSLRNIGRIVEQRPAVAEEAPVREPSPEPSRAAAAPVAEQQEKISLADAPSAMEQRAETWRGNR